MHLGKACTALLLTCITGNALAAEKGDETKENKPNYRLPDDTVPVHYKLEFIPHIVEDHFTFDGESSTDFKVLKPTSKVALHVKDLQLDESITKIVSKNGDVHVPKEYTYDNNTSILTMHLGENLEPGEYTLDLKFSGNISDDVHGLYRSEYEDEQNNLVWMIATHFEPTGARQAFPCWDEPALKATFDISIKHYANYTALSNMPIREQSEADKDDDKMWTRFERTPVMSTYLVGFVVADYENISNPDGTINVWCAKRTIPKAQLTYEIAQNASVELEKIMKRPLPVPKMDHVSVRTHSAAVMHNWGLVIYVEAALVFDEKSDGTLKKMGNVENTIEKLIHEWTGNLAGPTWWSHVWIPEGFGTYMKHYVADKMYDNWGSMDYFVIYTSFESMSSNNFFLLEPMDSNVTTPREIKTKIDSTVFGKAGSIFRMLAHIVSDEVLLSSMLKYVDAHKYSTGDADSLWKIIEETLAESKVPHDGFKVKEAMDTWIKQNSHPLITVKRDSDTGEIKITQEDYVSLIKHSLYFEDDDDDATERRSKNNTWWVPINYATNENPDFSDTKPSHWLKPKEELIINDIPKDDWIILNKQATGYYHVNYDEETWKKIANVLHSENYTTIHPLNRAQIIHDAVALLLIKRLSIPIFLNITSYLSQEKDYLPWHPALEFLRDYYSIVDLPEADAQIKPWILNMMKNVIEDLGYDERPDDDNLTKLLRADILSIACNYGHKECKDAATRKLAEYLNNPDEHPIEPNAKGWVYCAGIENGNETVWEGLLDVYVRDHEAAILQHLTCTDNPAILERFWNMSLTNDSKIPEKHQFGTFFGPYGYSRNIDAKIDYLIKYWNELAARFERVRSLIYHLSSRVKSKEQIDKLKELGKLAGLKDEAIEKELQSYIKDIEKGRAILHSWADGIKSLSKEA